MRNHKVSEIQEIKDLLVIELDYFSDFRGKNFEGYNKEVYSKLHPLFEKLSFKIDSFSFSKQNTLRGFHGDSICYKLIHIPHGVVQFSVIDIRKESSTFNKTFTTILDSNIPKQILVPAGCVNAHLCLSDICVFSYKLSEGYVEQEKQIHIKWNDPLFNIKWNITNPILSNRDK